MQPSETCKVITASPLLAYLSWDITASTKPQLGCRFERALVTLCASLHSPSGGGWSCVLLAFPWLPAYFSTLFALTVTSFLICDLCSIFLSLRPVCSPDLPSLSHTEWYNFEVYSRSIQYFFFELHPACGIAMDKNKLLKTHIPIFCLQTFKVYMKWKNWDMY